MGVTADTFQEKTLGQTLGTGGILMSANCMETVSVDAARSVDYSKLQVSPVVALRELYELLETYCPMWYTEEYHNMAKAALRQSTH